MGFSESLRGIADANRPSAGARVLPRNPSRSPPMAPISSRNTLCVALHTSAFSSAPRLFSRRVPSPSLAADTSTRSVEYRTGGAVLAVWPAALVQ